MELLTTWRCGCCLDQYYPERKGAGRLFGALVAKMVAILLQGKRTTIRLSLAKAHHHRHLTGREVC